MEACLAHPAGGRQPVADVADAPRRRRTIRGMSDLNTSLSGWRFDNSYTRLPAVFYSKAEAAKARAPALVVFNHTLAESLGLDTEALAQPEAASLFCGNKLPEGAAPIAQAYAGHQFGHFTMLGDGRALLLGEQLTPDGRRVDIQLKGSGPTLYARRGDGRAALGPMLREYLISEAMHALGIPTTRSLAVVATGEPVYRETALPGAVLTRIAASHLRVGTFQYAAGIDHDGALKALADYTIARHYPALAEADQPYLALLHAVIERQAALIAQWMHVGFIHGVMNTDNMAISGETIDYGPCAFMDRYDPMTVFSSIDRQGRYAYGNQPPIGQWNLTRFAETLLPLIHAETEAAIRLAEDALYGFVSRYEQAWLAGMRRKLGLLEPADADADLARDLLTCMQQDALDYTNTFRALTGLCEADATHESSGDRPLADPSPAMTAWLKRWRARLVAQSVAPASIAAAMREANPVVIPRNHQVEAALAAAQSGDLGPFERLLGVLQAPYEERMENAAYRAPAPPTDVPYQTFCGT